TIRSAHYLARDAGSRALGSGCDHGDWSMYGNRTVFAAFYYSTCSGCNGDGSLDWDMGVITDTLHCSTGPDGNRRGQSPHHHVGLLYQCAGRHVHTHTILVVPHVHF